MHYNVKMLVVIVADGVIAVTVGATGVSTFPYNVTITPSEFLPVSAREVFAC